MDFLISVFQSLWVIGWVLGLMVLPALAHCFFGYYILRVVWPIYGFAGGFVLGAWLVVYIRPQPGNVELYAGGIFVGVVLALGAWFLYRLFYGLFVGVFTIASVALPSWPPSPAFAAFLIAIGLGITLLIYHFASQLMRVLTAIIGAFWTIVILLHLIGWIETPDEVWQGGMITGIGMVAVTAMLAIMGCYVQFSVPRWIARGRKAKARLAARSLDRPRLPVGHAAPNMHPPLQNVRNQKQ
ncbi:MAG: TMEM198/TM7SF3 family protein [Phycisphaerae bacterium]|nr:TMEM198/TM7SF3 family protein [Phycisphaerae bacterium]